MTSPTPEQVFTAIADPTRRRILELLQDEPRAVHDLAAAFPVSRPAISRHLRLLTEAGLARARPAGRQNIYELEPSAFDAVRAWLDRFWDGRLALLKRLSEGDA